jgi:polyisoprenoid-binding protein YceI
MRNLKAILLALLIVFGITASAQTKKIDVTKSTLQWLAKKVGGQHSGTVNLKNGTLTFKGNKLSGGSFTVDMTTVTAMDLTGEYLDKLNGHLKSEDFFNTAKFPSATLLFTKIIAKTKSIYAVTANLTIKGITKTVTFDLTTTANSATTKFMVDRTQFGIQYGSKSFFESIGDKAIDNDFELKVILKL